MKFNHQVLAIALATVHPYSVHATCMGMFPNGTSAGEVAPGTTKITCNGQDSCRSATITGCDDVQCIGTAACAGATITIEAMGTGRCQGTAACFGANIMGTNMPSFTCDGTDCCQSASISGMDEMICEHNMGGGQDDACKFTQITTNAGGTVRCRGPFFGCVSSTINGADTVFCGDGRPGISQCQTSTINDPVEVYCSAPFSCQGTTVRNTNTNNMLGTVYCSAANNACAGAQLGTPASSPNGLFAVKCGVGDACRFARVDSFILDCAGPMYHPDCFYKGVQGDCDAAPDCPSSEPSLLPSSLPSVSLVPSLSPSGSPSELPSGMPSSEPSVTPSGSPSKLPSNVPSSEPSVTGSGSPSELPSGVPSSEPTGMPSLEPTSIPSKAPSTTPTELDLCQPLPFTPCGKPGKVQMAHDIFGLTCKDICVPEILVGLMQGVGWSCGACE